ncbi:unnamed protein product [Phytomonas sp. Hart1]|nr:unnamed protein product [Phytomonas sp. Hart1]|eukprot:CCW66353.1 unnamed protein product [Phytomonas sp. isolate Hart1]
MRFPKEKLFKHFIYRNAILSSILEMGRFPLMRELSELGLLTQSSNFEWVNADASLHPFRALELDALKDLSVLTVPLFHALFFSSLYQTFDPSLTKREAALISGLSVAGHRCISRILSLFMNPSVGYPHPRNSPSLMQGASNQPKCVHLKIAALLINSMTADSQVDTQSLASVLYEVDVLPTQVLASFLSIPASPKLLKLIVDHTVRTNGGHLDAALFPLLLGSLLSNDNFFTASYFDAMHAVVRNHVLLHVGGKGIHFDYVSVRWTPLMNKWARVYTKKLKAYELYECYQILLGNVPAAETKLPCSFYVRLIGLIMDCGVNKDAVGSQSRRDCWERLREVAVQALRLFGGNPNDLRVVWTVLLKAALTLEPLSDDWQRTLEAYHICAQSCHLVKVDRGGFLQVVRLVGATIVREPLDAVEQAIIKFLEFLKEQRNASFMWLLDGVGVLLSDLWNTHGAKARPHALLLQDALQKILNDRNITGVTLENNPTIKRTLEWFSIGEATPFWWQCGCGAELPASSKRCIGCLRSSTSKISWTCGQCGECHRSPCHCQICNCGAVNPRCSMATKSGYALCKDCGETLARGDLCCQRCKQHNMKASQRVVCRRCRSSHGANNLYCPFCFIVNTERPLHLWHCGACQEYNYSTWSSCQGCRAVRKAECITMPFLPWLCGCGAANHPCRLVCETCSSGVPSVGGKKEKAKALPSPSYTCVACQNKCFMANVTQTKITIGTISLRIHICEHCKVVHPRDRVVLSASSLSRHCMICSSVVDQEKISSDGEFYHCGALQRLNENIPFRCCYCKETTYLSVGFHCSNCGWPRPEIENVSQPYFIWQCLKEILSDSACCGTWNYSWCSQCTSCGQGRSNSPWEYQARAYSWQCDRCLNFNRPIDVLKCSHCAKGTQPALMYLTNNESSFTQCNMTT